MEKNIFTPKTLREIKNYDTFELASDFLNRKPISREYHMKPVFTEGVIKIIDDSSSFLNSKKKIFYIYLNDTTGTIEVYTYTREDYCFEFIFKITFNENIKSLEKLEFEKNKEYSYIKDEYLQVFVSSIVLEAMAYISYYTENRDTVIKHRSRKRNVNNINSKGEKNSIKRKIQILNKDKVIYEVNTSDDNLIKALRKYQRHTESWKVMGHKRTYKSGKVVWVSPYTKGTKKSEKSNEPKKYIIKSEGQL